jgi:quercetin dioxygenase-like cupin family protein
MSETIRMGALELRFLRSRESDGDDSPDLFEMKVQPDGRMPVAHHHDRWDETVYGLSGVLTMRVDGEDIPLRTGETVFVRRGIVHAFRNDGQEPARCLCILTPGVLGPAYFREMAALAAGCAPDPARMRETMLKDGLIPAPG